jgi:hypothetical protein
MTFQLVIKLGWLGDLSNAISAQSSSPKQKKTIHYCELFGHDGKTLPIDITIYLTQISVPEEDG